MIELMVVILIVAIMAGIALPSFASFINQNRLTRVKVLLLNDMNMARSEAIKTNSRYVVCPVNANATDCGASTDWASTGWYVCPALGAGTNCSDVTKAVAVRPPVTNGITITAANANGVIFQSLGSAVAAQTISFTGATGTTPGSVTVALTGAVALH